MHRSIMVLQFGGSVLQSESDLLRAAHEIYRWYREGYQVVIVMSALADKSSELIFTLEKYSKNVDSGIAAALIASGEAHSAAMLGLVLDRAGMPVSVLNSSALHLQTCGSRRSAEALSLDVSDLLDQLQHNPVVIIPGLVGCDSNGNLSVLGPDGADVSALLIAYQLGGRCRLIKDVDGLYECDPSLDWLAPRRFSTITCEDALALDSQAVHKKAVEFAQQWLYPFEIASLAERSDTVIGHSETSFSPFQPYPMPVHVGILGLGVVGTGVLRSLLSESDRFVVTGVAVKDKNKERDFPIPAHVYLSERASEIVESDCDLIIELIGGLEPAGKLIRAALRSGKHVITANKLLVETCGEDLHRVAEAGGSTLCYSAAVGGAVPMLETVSRIAQHYRIREVAGVLNGTCNFILDKLMQGLSFKESLYLAQVQGFTEADPTQDLDGSDAAHKLVLLSRAAFGASPSFMQKSGIDSISEQEVYSTASSGNTVKLVAKVVQQGAHIQAQVGVETMDADHPFASIHAEHNALIVTTECGRVFTLRGRGAGRWPTAEAVLADSLNIWRSLRGQHTPQNDILIAVHA